MALFSFTIYRDGGRPYNLIKMQNDKNIDVGNDGLALQDGLIFSLGKFTCFLEVSCNSCGNVMEKPTIQKPFAMYFILIDWPLSISKRFTTRFSRGCRQCHLGTVRNRQSEVTLHEKDHPEREQDRHGGVSGRLSELQGKTCNNAFQRFEISESQIVINHRQLYQ